MLLAAAVHAAARPVAVEVVLGDRPPRVGVLAIAAAWRRPSDAECALWIDRRLGGASAFTTLLEPAANAAAHAPARRWLERWAAAKVPELLGRSARNGRGVRRPSAAVDGGLRGARAVRAEPVDARAIGERARRRWLPSASETAMATSAADPPVATQLAGAIANALRSPGSAHEQDEERARQRGGDVASGGPRAPTTAAARPPRRARRRRCRPTLARSRRARRVGAGCGSRRRTGRRSAPHRAATPAPAPTRRRRRRAERRVRSPRPDRGRRCASPGRSGRPTWTSPARSTTACRPAAAATARRGGSAAAALPPAVATRATRRRRDGLRAGMDEGDRAQPMTTELPADADFADAHRRLLDLRAILARVIVGQDELVGQLVTAVFASGHVLIEGLPGLGKTHLAKALAAALGLQWGRVQCTPDLMPADVTGAEIYVTAAGGASTFEFRPARCSRSSSSSTRSTGRRRDAIGAARGDAGDAGDACRRRHALPRPFCVLATQNPIELEGTYPLPEAQLDRFMFKLTVPFPSRESLHALLDVSLDHEPADALEPIAGPADVLRITQLCRTVLLAARCKDRRGRPRRRDAARSRRDRLDPRRHIRYGASPRALQALVRAARVRAVMAGRAHVDVDDLAVVALPVLRHRRPPAPGKRARRRRCRHRARVGDRRMARRL
jgi:MoxR-like ATPase